MQGDVHKPVLLQEVINGLNIKPNGIYIDATFGRGGHAREILNRLSDEGYLLAIDKDTKAVEWATEYFKEENFSIKQGPFSMLASFAHELGIAQKVQGILLDLGVSSPQLDEAERGFSFLQDGPLDMRMDTNQGLTAADWINAASESEIATVLFQFGEERYAKRIARAIVKEREQGGPIMRTRELARIVAEANPAWEKHKHPATRSFQAIRIFINEELEQLKACLEQAVSILAVGGRLAVISFHSLEDRIVKNFIQREERGDAYPRDLPIRHDQLKSRLKRVVWGVRATEDEVRANPRSRSAVLRVAEKLL